jgi:hypothetical protein
MHMSAAALEAIARQIEQLAPEEKWTLLSLLIESLRPQDEPTRRQLGDYYGLGKGRGYRSAQEADATIAEERDSWDK